MYCSRYETGPAAGNILPVKNLKECGKLVKTTDSEAGTLCLGEEISSGLKEYCRNVFLLGDLGSGKTTFVKGLGRGLGISSEEIVSPTFQLIRKYSGRRKIVHIDLYRLKQISEILHLGWWDLLDSENITAVEWADRAWQICPDKALYIKMEVTGPSERRFFIYNEKKNVFGN